LPARGRGRRGRQFRCCSGGCGGRREGREGFPHSPRAILGGDDICSTLRLWLEEGEIPDTPIAQAFFASGSELTSNRMPSADGRSIAASPGTRFYRPMSIKTALDDALLAAGVEFLFFSYPSDRLVDTDAAPCGIIIANRAGRQAVLAKVVIDATTHAVVARMAGAEFAVFHAGSHTFRRIVIGSTVREGNGLSTKVRPTPFLKMAAGRGGQSPATYSLI